jgi:ComF family protein
LQFRQLYAMLPALETHPYIFGGIVVPQEIVEQVLDILFPPRCAGCQKSGSILCPTCIAKVRPFAPPFCPHCGMALPTTYAIRRQCQYHRLYLSGLRASGSYEEPLRSYIHALKYDGNRRLAKPLGQLLAQTCINYGLRADAIVPVPLHRNRQKERGYNHAHLLAEVCAAQVNMPLRCDIVIRHRDTSAQVGLTASQRQQNVAGAFSCIPAFTQGALYGRTFLIIDDVCTTGATVEACAAPLFAAGAKAVWGLVLARPV